MASVAVATPIPPLTRDQAVLTIGIMSAIAVAALDSTVVGTAMPTIIGQLGGLSQYHRVRRGLGPVWAGDVDGGAHRVPRAPGPRRAGLS